jgi:hypothetical protein
MAPRLCLWNGVPGGTYCRIPKASAAPEITRSFGSFVRAARSCIWPWHRLADALNRPEVVRPQANIYKGS